MKKMSLKMTPQNAPYYFMAPGIILFGVFGAYPIIASFLYSFQEKIGSKATSFIGIDNYIKAFKDTVFLLSLKNIFIIFLMHAPLMIFMSLILAHILNSKTTKFKNGFRTAFFLPNVTNAVAYTMLFKILLSNDGVVNGILSRLNISPIQWLSDQTSAKWVISIMIIWRWLGYNMVIFLAAMQSITEDVYEAADIDGASKLQQFFSITVPLMKNPIIFTIVMTVSGTLNLFAESQLLVQGGPNYGTFTPALEIYTVAWKQFNFGYASALSYIVSLITIVIAFVQFNLGKEKD
ncbi:MAG: lactose transporter permease [Eubacterium sp.]|jgi:lactose/L-arabinose transport system permease protein|nr:lactose transporter permease [Eubacterium sp.]